MGIRNRGREELLRLECKTLDARFKQEVQHGLNCSPFEAEAIVNVVREVYLPFIDRAAPAGPPGKLTLVAVCADEPAGKPVADGEKRTVCLTVHGGVEDDRRLFQAGAEAFRQAKIPGLRQEALSQGALLTREDLAYRVFFVSPRTISRDLAALRLRAQTYAQGAFLSNCDLALLLNIGDDRISALLCEHEQRTGTVVPRRATLHDMGSGLTHKRIICLKRYAEGKEPPEIAQETYHGLEAVDRYLGQYDRVRHCRLQGLGPEQTAYALAISPSLVKEYWAIDDELGPG